MRHLLFLLVAVSLLLLAGFLSGCAVHGHHGEVSGMTSYDGVSADYPGDAQTISGEVAAELAKRYPPGKTTLALVKTDSTFGQDLEAALRTQAFSVAGANASGIRVAYTLDVIQGHDPESCYIKVRTSDGQAFGTVHPLSGTPHRMHADKESETKGVLLPAAAPLTPRVLRDALPSASPAPASVAAPAPAASVPPSTLRDAQPSLRPIPSGRTAPVRRKATAARVAPDTVLPAGQHVRLHGPAVERPCPSGPARPVAPVPAPMPAAIEPAGTGNPIPAALPVQTAQAATPASAPGPRVVVPPSGSPATPLVSATALPAPTAKAPAPTPSTPENAPVALPAPEWNVQQGSLYSQLEGWANRAQYQLIWKATHDYELEAQAAFGGDFVEAIKQLFVGLHRGGHALRVTVYQGNKVIEVAED